MASRKPVKSVVNKSLYEDKHPKTSLKGTGYANKEKAIKTLELIENYNITYQKQVVLTMYNRAKFHKYQTMTIMPDDNPVSPISFFPHAQ
jgi:hypothetical protein